MAEANNQTGYSESVNNQGSIEKCGAVDYKVMIEH